MPDYPTGRPFARRTALVHGITDSALAHGVRVERLDRLRRGVYGASCERDALCAIRAGAVAYPDIPSSHLSSATLSGIPIVGQAITLPEVTVAPRGPGNVRGAHVYRARVRDHETRVVDGCLCLSPARTVVDIARHYSTLTAVVALDHVLHTGMASVEEIRDVLDFCRRWPGAPKARKAAQLCDSRSESPLESLSRLVLRRFDVPAPELQVRIYDTDSGIFVGRTDFYWDELGVAGEADGLGKYGDPTSADPGYVVLAERAREHLLEDVGLEVARWDWPMAWTGHSVLWRCLERAIERAAARQRGGLPRRWRAVPTERLPVI